MICIGNDSPYLYLPINIFARVMIWFVVGTLMDVVLYHRSASVIVILMFVPVLLNISFCAKVHIECIFVQWKKKCSI